METSDNQLEMEFETGDALMLFDHLCGRPVRKYFEKADGGTWWGLTGTFCWVPPKDSMSVPLAPWLDEATMEATIAWRVYGVDHDADGSPLDLPGRGIEEHLITVVDRGRLVVEPARVELRVAAREPTPQADTTVYQCDDADFVEWATRCARRRAEMLIREAAERQAGEQS